MSGGTKVIPADQFSTKETVKKNICCDETTLSKDKYWFYYAVAFSVTLFLMSAMTSIGWTSPTLPILLSPESPIGQITSDESGWIMVALTIGTLLSPIPVAYLMNKIGQKLCLICGAFPMIISWLLIAFAKTITWIYCARILQGITINFAIAIIPMYLGEIASNECRGSVLIIMNVMTKLGYIFIYSIGPYVSICTMALIALIFPVAFLLTFPFMPESPYYLIGTNKPDKALGNLKRLRGHNNVNDEFEQIKEIVKRSEENPANYMELFTTDNRKCLWIMIGLVTASHLSGGNTILAYAGLIFIRINNQLRSSETIIILSIVQLFAAITLTFIVDRIGRRVILICSSIGTGLANTIVFLYFLLERQNIDVSEIGLVPVIALFCFIISYAIGLSGICLMMMGEIFPKQLRGHAGAVYTIYSGFIATSVGKLFQVISDYMGSDVIFGMFALFCFLTIPLVYYVIPETRGRSLDEIQKMIKSGKLKQ